VGQAALGTEGAHLVLEQLAQGLDELQLHLFGQAAHVVVRLDGGRRAFVRDGFDDVRVQGSLHQVVGAAQLVRFLIEHGDEFAAG